MYKKMLSAPGAEWIQKSHELKFGDTAEDSAGEIWVVRRFLPDHDPACYKVAGPTSDMGCKNFQRHSLIWLPTIEDLLGMCHAQWPWSLDHTPNGLYIFSFGSYVYHHQDEKVAILQGIQAELKGLSWTGERWE